MARAAAPTLTAIHALFPVRTADPNNTRASAALPVGGAWEGTAILTDDYLRADADITCPVDASGRFYAIHGPTTAAVDGCDPTVGAAGCIVETFPAMVVWTALRARLAFRDKAFRLSWRGTAGSVVAITTNLDPRPVEDSIPIYAVPVAAIANGASADFAIPPGARRFHLGTINNTTVQGVTSTMWRLIDTAGAVNGNAGGLNSGQYSDRCIQPITTLTTGALAEALRIINNGANPGSFWVLWLP